jgi:polysaccharide biosynthesis/export protein
MNKNFDGNSEPGSGRHDDAYHEGPASRGPIRVYPNGNGNGHRTAPQPSSPFTVWTALDLLSRRWGWIFLGALLGGAGLFVLGTKIVKPKFTATGQLMRHDTPASQEFFQDLKVSSDTFAGLIRSPALLTRVGAEMDPPLPPEKLIKCIKVEPQVDSDMITVWLAARSPKAAVDGLDVYLREAEKFGKEYQQDKARETAHNFLKSQVNQLEQDIELIGNQMRGKAGFAPLARKLDQVGTNLNALSANLATSQSSMMVDLQVQRLNKAFLELNELQSKFTDIHPDVKAKKTLVEELKFQLQTAATNGNPAHAGFPSSMGPKSGDSFDPELDMMRTKFRSLDEARIQLNQRLFIAEVFATNAPGLARIFARPTIKTVETNMRWAKIGLVTVFGGFAGVGAMLGIILLIELTGRKLKTPEDLSRITKLPVLATLGDLGRMDEHDRSQWAFRAWTMLQGRLSRSANHGLVCGITSSANGEGRSTWISMLAEAASLTGFRVLTISTRPSPTHSQLSEGDVGEPEPNFPVDPGINEANHHASALATNVLTSPARVTEQLTGPNSQPVVHIPLPGWVWNLERRKQWREALLHWRKIDNLVILVELPPADVAEAVLLGSNLPNLLWLADTDVADAAETRAQLETLRHARCNLVGAVLNRDSSRSIKRNFPRWVECTTLLLGLSVLMARGQEVIPPTPAPAVVPPAVAETSPPSTNLHFSVVNPSQRAAWQQRLTVGPGDVLTFGVYGQPELTRIDVAIPPDGVITFLEARNVVATGLTIDELRGKLDEELGKFRRAPRTIITPVSFRSKKYYMLGKVMTKGVYTLDRPITVLEALARAHGFESGLIDRNIVDLADMQRSFLVREGKRIPLNFERLFQHGDLSQNIAIEPNDYIYFSPAGLREVYVVGEVRLPGPVSYTPSTTIIAAITERGGYTERAFKMRVLVVRGSINNPQTFAVNTHAILDGNAPDFKLEPRDIVYVNSRPFIRVEELADLAATAFIQSLISSWVGVDVVKPIQ